MPAELKEFGGGVEDLSARKRGAVGAPGEQHPPVGERRRGGAGAIGSHVVDRRERVGGGVEDFSARETRGPVVAPGHQHPPVGEGRCGGTNTGDAHVPHWRESVGGGVVDLGAREVVIPAVVVGAAGDQHPPVGEWRRDCAAAGGAHRADPRRAERAGGGVEDLGAREVVIPAAVVVIAPGYERPPVFQWRRHSGVAGGAHGAGRAEGSRSRAQRGLWGEQAEGQRRHGGEAELPEHGSQSS